jgi:hypothetical protein
MNVVSAAGVDPIVITLPCVSAERGGVVFKEERRVIQR